MWSPAAPLAVSPEQRHTLESWSRAHNTPKIVATRADIVLLAAEGSSNNSIASQLGITRVSVIEWRKRFAAEGLEALGKVREGRGRPRTISPEKVSQIIHLTLNTLPEHATHWSCRSMATRVGVSSATVQRVWSEHRVYPHRVRTFKLSKDPRFVEKLTDVVGLYLNPPDKAAVLCVDEKSMIQALDRTQPGLPIKPGKAGTMTHDYKRHGTTSLYAALNILDGEVVGQCTQRHRHQEFLRFLRRLDREFPKSLDLHLVLDNSSTHSHVNVRTWLDAHPRFRLHFVPTSSSWLNLVEGLFADLTKRRLKRGSFASVDDLIGAIIGYLDHRNLDPKPFVWTASVERILAKLRDCKAVIETIH
jgi:transposase